MARVDLERLSRIVLTAFLLPILAGLLIRPTEAVGRQGSPNPVDGNKSALEVPLGKLVEGIACRNDATQTYTLYLPSRYSSDRSWPVLFVFDPRGRSVRAAEIFRAAAERYGWILMSSDNTRSDGPWDPNFKAVSAMGPDVSRYAYDAKRIYATGFSGGAMLAWIWGQQTRELAGVISSGGRPVKPPESETEVSFAHFGAAGDEEFNYEPTRELDATAARLGAPHRFESFPGPHAWMPPDLALEAVEWMELEAMRSGTRPLDAGLVATLYEKDLRKAQELESSGDSLKALRRFEAIARTFVDLHAIEDVSERATTLARSPRLKQALEEETSARKYEKAQLLRMARGLGRFRAVSDRTRRSSQASQASQASQPAQAGPLEQAGRPSRENLMSVSELELQLGIPRLLARSKSDAAKGFAARRVLNSMAAQLGFYMPRDFLQANDYPRAAVVLELATRIAPPRPFVLYNLASAWAKTGRRKKALSALAEAVDAGFSNVEFIEQDEDLNSLRKLPSYQELISRMKGE